jgi:hypothetical protein
MPYGPPPNPLGNNGRNGRDQQINQQIDHPNSLATISFRAALIF